MELDKNKAGLILGSFFALWHLTWCLVVAVGVGQLLLDWVYYLHFLSNPFRVAAFNGGTAIALVLVTSIAGFILGWVFAFLWNGIHGSR